MYGKQDDKNACLKFIMALYIYLYKIESCMALQDVDFINHPHFPEYDKRVGEYFHEREDHGHVLKRFTTASEMEIFQELISEDLWKP